MFGTNNKEALGNNYPAAIVASWATEPWSASRLHASELASRRSTPTLVLGSSRDILVVVGDPVPVAFDQPEQGPWQAKALRNPVGVVAVTPVVEHPQTEIL